MDSVIKKDSKNWLDTPFKFKFNQQTLILLIIFAAAIFTRLYLLGTRVMSHDEINHVYFAYQFYNGGEYVHNPITHGPLQFHLLELSYFLFNVSDFSAGYQPHSSASFPLLSYGNLNGIWGKKGRFPQLCYSSYLHTCSIMDDMPEMKRSQSFSPWQRPGQFYVISTKKTINIYT